MHIAVLMHLELPWLVQMHKSNPLPDLQDYSTAHSITIVQVVSREASAQSAAISNGEQNQHCPSDGAVDEVHVVIVWAARHYRVGQPHACAQHREPARVLKFLISNPMAMKGKVIHPDAIKF